MKSKLSVVALLSIASLAALASCGDSATDKIGVVLIGDETEGYSEAHIKGIDAAAKSLGISDKIVYKKKILEDSGCKTAIDDLVSSGCGLVVSNSYGHQDYMVKAAAQYPNNTFVAMTGDFAAISGASNFKNAFVSIYEARYVSGVVAGMKLKALADAGSLDTTFNKDKAGNWKIGYVGAFSYAEVISGFTSFYLGVKSVVSNVSMEVSFTNSWFDIDKEGAAADTLVKDGCVIIGQHADSTGAPAKVESLLGASRTDDPTKKYVCYSVGFNIDMIPTAPHAALTSALNLWEVYYTYAFSQFVNKKDIQQDWCKGYNDGAVAISDLNTASVASGTADKVSDVVSKIKAGSLHVFDTSSFTVDGKTITSAQVDLSYYSFATGSAVLVYQGQTVEAIKTSGSSSYFAESTYRAAPYFSLKIDGITWLTK
jgi:basic membrane protein A and related proteins